MKKIYKFLTLFLLVLQAHSAMAAPAWPGKVRMQQPDGSVVEAYVRGDEYFSWYERVSDGLVLTAQSGGVLRPVVDKETFLAKVPTLRAARKAAARQGARRAPGAIDPVFPTTGTVRGLVLLVEFPDARFSADATREAYDAVFNTENYNGPLSAGSARDYFKAQSSGKFTPEFDVVGPVCMKNNYAYYGDSPSGVEPVDKMFKEACDLADAQGVDFSRYDCNDDGEVDFLFVVYAGYGQAQGGPIETIWPQAVDLTYKVWDTYDGLYLGQAACTCELHGYEGKQIDGIGTFCHEFSHILGLPDVYDVFYSGSYGMGHWDVMDVGSYNGESRCPAGYTAMDRYTVGWLTPTVLTEGSNEAYTLSALGDSNEAYFIVSEKDNNEYFTLENRQQTGWDTALPGHGMLISHVKYDQVYWKTNMLNTGASPIDHILLVAADREWTTDTEAGDVFPGVNQVTSYGIVGGPAREWYAEGSAPFSLSNMKELSDGQVSFNYNSGSSSGIYLPFVSATVGNGELVVDNPDCLLVEIFGIDGKPVVSARTPVVRAALAAGPYVVKQGRRSFKVFVK